MTSEQLELDDPDECSWCADEVRCPWHTVLPHDWPEHVDPVGAGPMDGGACCGCPDCECISCDPDSPGVETVTVIGGLL